MSARPTALIVGGGIGGLLTALKLLRDGFSVTVVERNQHFGGCNGRIEIDGQRAPAAFYTALGLEAGGTLVRSLWPADDDVTGQGAAQRMSVCDHVFSPEGDIPLAGDLEGFQRQLSDRFAAEGEGLATLGRDIRSVYDAIHTLFLPVTPPQRMQAMQTLRRFGSLPYRQYLHRLIDDAALRRLLSIRAFASTNTACTVLAYLAKGLIDGFYRLPEAGSGVVDRLLCHLREHGDQCHLLTGRNVERLRFADGRAVGVRTVDGEVFDADHVVLNTDVRQIAHRLIDDPVLSQPLIEHIEEFASGLSALTLIFATGPEMTSQLAAHRHTARLVLLDCDDPFALLTAREGGAIDSGMIKLNIDLDGSPGRLYAELDCAPQARFDGLDFAAMAGREEACLAPLVEQVKQRIEVVFPGFSAAVREVRVLTPHNYGQMTGSTSGAGSGWRDAVSMPNRVEAILARLGLQLVGQWSMYGSGLSQLETSAQAALREIRRQAAKRGDR